MKRNLTATVALVVLSFTLVLSGCGSSGGNGKGGANADGGQYSASDVAGRWKVSEVDEKGDKHGGVITFGANLSGATLVMDAYNNIVNLGGTLTLSPAGKLTGTLVCSAIMGNDRETHIFTFNLQFTSGGTLSGIMYSTYKRKYIPTGKVTVVYTNVPKKWALTR